MKLLSIIIPVFNNEKYLSRCFDSILNQPNIEQIKIIAVDDGSTDGSLNILQDYQFRYPKYFEFISIENQGVSNARNVGLSLVNTDFLTFIDSDDWVSSTLYQYSLPFIEQSSYDFICYDFVEHWPYSETKYVSSLTRCERSRYYVANVVWNKIYRTQFWRQHEFKFMTGVRYEDVELIARLCSKTQKIGHLNLDNCVVNYDRCNPTSFMNTGRDFESLETVFKSLLNLYTETNDVHLLKFIATTYFFQMILFSGQPRKSWNAYRKYRVVFDRKNIESKFSRCILLIQLISADFLLLGILNLLKKLDINANKL